jgi:hypothetical protein
MRRRRESGSSTSSRQVTSSLPLCARSLTFQLTDYIQLLSLVAMCLAGYGNRSKKSAPRNRAPSVRSSSAPTP